MRAAVYDGKEVQIREIEKPKISDDEILIEVKACGVCGTDVHIVEGEFPVTPPVVLGHELSGKIIEIGRETSTEVEIGDKVSVNPNIPCGTCFLCQSGKPHLCKNLQSIGITLNGGFSEFLKVPKEHVFKLEKANYLEGIFSEPLACCLHGIDQLRPKMGETVVLFGAGSIGLLMVQLLNLSGISKLFLSEPIPERRELAKELGVDRVIDPTKEDPAKVISSEIDGGIDNVLEVSGDPRLLKTSVDVVKRGGKILQFGVNPMGQRIDISPFKIYRKEISIFGSFTNPFTQQRAVNLIETDRVKLLPLVTHRLSLKDIKEGLDLVKENRGIKVIIMPEFKD